jgi:hypothetical protein
VGFLCLIAALVLFVVQQSDAHTSGAGAVTTYVLSAQLGVAGLALIWFGYAWSIPI